MRLRPPARAVVLAGFMGTGKSAVGRLLARRWGWKLLETDSLIEQSSGRRIPDIFSESGEEAFRDLETTVIREAAERRQVIISTGGGALLREANLAALREAGPVVCLEASADTIYRRTERNNYRPLLWGDNPRAEIERLLIERAPTYARADYHIATDDLTTEQVGEHIVQALGQDPRAAYVLGQPLRIPVTVPGAEYEVQVGRGLLPELGRLVPPPRPGVRAAIITTDSLRPLYGELAVAGLRAGGWDPALYQVPDGETSKRMAVAESLCEELAETGHDRSSWVFAVGGGVIGDLGGFVAALFMRGIPFVTVPTSLLAQVDASVGGKVGVNLTLGKNLVGAFHQPRAVIIDVQTLATLPPRQWGEGLAEIVKHAALADAELFEYLETEGERVRSGDDPAWEYLVARNCQIKAEVVGGDPEERGWRAVLNLGHTVGHALERAAEQWGLGHGEAVALGMLAETRWTEQRGWTPSGTSRRLAALLERLGLPVTCPELDRDLAQQALRADKKLRSGALSLPVLGGIGSVTLREGIGLPELLAALALAWEGGELEPTD